ncbi:charged multivesicular body protein 4a [Pteropus alecto]|uniref:charged multivesicular body protein 4a n=1 Tax=Pteropus alecto TaxID=9402 RepID=UPI0007688B1C|nr:charged multivesicular body protein 4a [Pteropus alecto]
MRLLRWIPGKKKKGPTPEEAIQKLKESEKILIKKQEFLEQKIQQEDLDKVDELMADITESQEVAKHISDAISQPVGFGDDVDEDELLEELEELEQEELARELLHVGEKEEEPPFKLPSVPSTHLPAGPALEEGEDEALKQLAEWVS